MKHASDLNFCNEKEDTILKLMRLKKDLELIPDEYKRLEYLETAKTEYEEGAQFCELQIKKIKKLHKYKREFNAFSSSPPSPSSSKNYKLKLSLSQIALKHVWEGQCITNENCDEIARQFGHTSGNALYNRFCTYSSAANRKASTDLTRKQLKNKIKLFESVIELLPESRKTIPQEELYHLLNKIEDF